MNFKKHALKRLAISIVALLLGLILIATGGSVESGGYIIVVIGLLMLSVSMIFASLYRTLLTSANQRIKLSDGSVYTLNDEAINAKKIDNIYLGENALIHNRGFYLVQYIKKLIVDIEDSGNYIVVSYRVPSFKNTFKMSTETLEEKYDRIVQYKIKKKDPSKDYYYEIKKWLGNNNEVLPESNIEYKSNIESGGIYMEENKKTPTSTIIALVVACLAVVGLIGFVVMQKLSAPKDGGTTGGNTTNQSGYTIEKYKEDLLAYTDQNSFVDYLVDAKSVTAPVSITIEATDKANNYNLLIINDGKEAYTAYVDVVDESGNYILESGVALLKPNDYYVKNFDSEVEPYDYVVSNDKYIISTFGDYTTNHDGFWAYSTKGFCVSIILNASDLNYDKVVDIAKNYFSYNSISGIDGDRLVFLDSSVVLEDLYNVSGEALDSLYAEKAVYTAILNINDNNISVYDNVDSDATFIESVTVE